MRVAVIGLGSMGGGAARSLLRAGFDVVGCDVSAPHRDAFVLEGGLAEAGASAAAHNAEAVVVMVVNAAQTRAVLFGDEGAARHMAKGGVIISSATVTPDDARKLAVEAKALGLHYLDAPISGGSVKAAAGTVTVMASGTEAAFSRAKPVLDAIAQTVHDLGREAGLGSAFKCVNQLLAGVHIAAACEAMVFAKSLGLDPGRVFDVITGSAGNSWMFQNRVPHILEGDYTPRSAVNIFIKDLGIVTGMGELAGCPLPLSETALKLFAETAAAGMGRDDDASVARHLAAMAGVALPGMESGHA